MGENVSLLFISTQMPYLVFTFQAEIISGEVTLQPRKHLKDLIVGKVVPDVHNLFPISERFRNFQASSSALHPPLLLLLLHSELFFHLILLSH